MGLMFLAVKKPNGINEKDIGAQIADTLASGSAFHVAVVPELVNDYEFLYWPEDAVTEILAIARKEKKEG